MLKIGDFSKLSRVSIRMLRHYDQLGLLVPKETDDFTGYRYYSEDQLPVASRITALKDMGFRLAAIGEILASYDDPTALAAILTVKRTELAGEAEEEIRCCFKNPARAVCRQRAKNHPGLRPRVYPLEYAHGGNRAPAHAARRPLPLPGDFSRRRV